MLIEGLFWSADVTTRGVLLGGMRAIAVVSPDRGGLGGAAKGPLEVVRLLLHQTRALELEHEPRVQDGHRLGPAAIQGVVHILELQSWVLGHLQSALLL